MLRIAACVKPKPAQGEIEVFDCFFEPLVSAFHLLVLEQSSLASEAAACRDGETLAPFAAKFNFQVLRHFPTWVMGCLRLSQGEQGRKMMLLGNAG